MSPARTRLSNAQGGAFGGPSCHYRTYLVRRFDAVPAILFNVGNVSVGTDGLVSADLAASILGISASAKVTGVLDDTFSTIFAATTEFTYDLGQGPETTRDFAPWFRWTE